MLNGKAMIILLTAGLIKIQLCKRSYFPKHTLSRNKIEVELDLSNYATKSDLKNTTVVDTSDITKKPTLS